MIPSRVRKTLALVAVAALAAVGFGQPAGSGDDTLRLALAYPADDTQQLALTTFDDTHNVIDGGVELLLWPGDEERLRATGIEYRVTVNDLQARDALTDAVTELAPIPGIPGGTNDYRDLHEMYAEFDALEATAAGIEGLTADVITQPETSFEGREVKRIEIFKGDGHDGRPVAYIDGIHHAREWPAAEYPVIFAHYLVENHDSPRVDALLRKVRVVIVPVVNVDGFVYSRGWAGTALDEDILGIVAGGQGAYVRKTQRNNPGVETKVDGEVFYGVDPNRNYSYLWGGTTGGIGISSLPVYASTSANPLDQTFHGHDSFTEPEVRNTRQFFLTNNVITYLSNHTSGRLVLRPWGHTTRPAPDEAILNSLGADLANAMIGAGFNSPYENKIGLGLYATVGTSNDWAYAATGTLGYVIEHSTSFHPGWNTSHGPGQVWPYAVEMFLRAAEAAAVPANAARLTGAVLDEAGNEVAATLTLAKSFYTPYADASLNNYGARASLKDGVNEAQTLTLETDGTFTWVVNPSTRPIVQDTGGTEKYTLTAETADGRTATTEILVARGETLPIELTVR